MRTVACLLRKNGFYTDSGRDMEGVLPHPPLAHGHIGVCRVGLYQNHRKIPIPYFGKAGPGLLLTKEGLMLPEARYRRGVYLLRVCSSMQRWGGVATSVVCCQAVDLKWFLSGPSSPGKERAQVLGIDSQHTGPII